MARRTRVKMPSATSVVARSYPDHVIGIQNSLPWRLRSDLQHFKKLTTGHAIIMGRKTYESLGRPLPNRMNIVLSRETFSDSESLKWAKDVPTALMLADVYSICNMRKQFFVIGGEIIYRAFERYINKVWITEVFSGRMQGDATFDYEFSVGEWWTPYEMDFQPKEGDDYPFRISCKLRRRQYHRERSKEEFMSYEPVVEGLLEQWDAFIESEMPEVEQLSLFD